MKIYATRLGLIPSSEIAFVLRVEADHRRRAERRARDREARAAERATRRRERWSRWRGGLGGGPLGTGWRTA